MGAAAAFLSAALVAVGGALGSPSQATETLEVRTSLNARYQFGDYCPPDASTFARCVRFVGTGWVPGLGRGTSTYTKVLPGDEDCPVIQFNTAVLAIAGKGELELSRAGRRCGPTAPAEVGPLAYTVTNGTGAYSGASGTFVFKSSVYSIDFGCNCGQARDTWTGTLTVPGATFDVTAPSFTGARSKTVRVPKTARGIRVRYAVVTARDIVDGSIPVTCTPRSGSFFEVGRTLVSCSATDSSGNTATTRFAVTVKRART